MTLLHHLLWKLEMYFAKQRIKRAYKEIFNFRGARDMVHIAILELIFQERITPV